jgi:YbgC/YbaW family acyl-CoA thioester hydrolase
VSFVHTLRVRYQEADMQRHVYFPRLLEYCDVAMVEFLRDLGWPYEQLVDLGFDPVVVKVEIEFERPARFDEQLAIEVTPTRFGRSSFGLAFQIRGLDDVGVAQASISYVNFDAEERVSRPIPASVRAKLAAVLPPG